MIESPAQEARRAFFAVAGSSRGKPNSIIIQYDKSMHGVKDLLGSARLEATVTRCIILGS